VQLWRQDGSFIRKWQVRHGAIRGLRFSPDGQLLIVASEGTNQVEGSTSIWRISGDHVRDLDREDAYDASFSANGQTIASATGRRIKLWRVQDGRLLRTLEGHSDRVITVNFSYDPSGSNDPNKQLLASASADESIRLWTATGDPIATLQEHSGEISEIAFSRDGRTLASASLDKRALLWELPDHFGQGAIEQLLKQGCTLARNYLTKQPNQELQGLCRDFPPPTNEHRQNEIPSEN
jgi:WD40 repeat protein